MRVRIVDRRECGRRGLLERQVEEQPPVAVGEELLERLRRLAGGADGARLRFEREKRPLEEVDGLSQLVAQADTELKPEGGRVLLRYSGTEPKARLLIEGPNRALLEKWNTRISEVLKKHLGA